MTPWGDSSKCSTAPIPIRYLTVLMFTGSLFSTKQKEKLQSLVGHQSSDHECQWLKSRPCPFLGQTLLRHTLMLKGVRCDGCGEEPIKDSRFKCASCENFDLCGRCQKEDRHPEHEMRVESSVTIFNYDPEKSEWRR